MGEIANKIVCKCILQEIGSEGKAILALGKLLRSFEVVPVYADILDKLRFPLRAEQRFLLETGNERGFATSNQNKRPDFRPRGQDKGASFEKLQAELAKWTYDENRNATRTVLKSNSR